MAKILLLQQQQCELINYSQESANLSQYKLLTSDSREYTAIIAVLDKNTAEELAEAVTLGHIFYKLTDISHYFIAHPVTNSNKPEFSFPFMMENGKPSEFAQQVTENLYQAATNKTLLLSQIEAGELTYTIFDATQESPPENATPLFIYPPSESAKIKSACERFQYRNLLNTIYQSIISNLTSISLQTNLLDNLLYSTAIVAAISSLPTVFGKHQEQKTELELYRHSNRDKPLNNFLVTTNTQAIKEIINNNLNSHTTLRTPRLNHPGAVESFLHVAIVNDDLDNFMHVLMQGYDITKPNSDGEFIFTRAAIYNSFKLLHYVVKELEIDLNLFQETQYPLKHSMLIRAIDLGHDEFAHKLIEYGLNINYQYKSNTLLHLIANLPYHSTNMHRLAKLVELGADINLLNHEQLSPVFIAGIKNHTEALEFFLGKKCKVSFGTLPDIKNLLTICMKISSYETIEILLQHKLNPFAYVEKYFDQKNFVYEAIPLTAAIIRNDVTIIDLLVSYNVNLNKYPTYAENLFLIASSNTNTNMMFYLAKHGVSTKKFKRYINEHATSMTEAARENAREFLNIVKEWRTYQKEHLKNREEELKYFREQQKIDLDKLNIIEFNHAYSKYKESKQNTNDQQCQEKLSSLTEWTNTISEFNYRIRIATHIILLLIGLKAIYNIYYGIRNNNTNKPLEDNTPKIKKPGKNKSLSENKSSQIDLSQHFLLSEKISNLHDQLIKISKLITECEHEEKNIFMQAILINKINIYEKYRKIEVEKGLHTIQVPYNEKVTHLHIIATSITKQLTHHCVDKSGLNSLNACKSELKQLQSKLNDYLKNTRTKTANEIDMLHKETDCTTQSNLIQTFKFFRMEILQCIQSAEQSISDIEELKAEMSEHKKLSVSKTITTQKSLFIKKPAETDNKTALENSVKPVIELKTPNKNNTTRTIKSTSKQSKTITTSPDKTIASSNHSIFISNSSSPEKIKKDNRLHYAVELILTMQNVVNDNNIDNIYKTDAALYLLIKSSHLIAQLANKHKTIILPHNDRMYHLRNNLIHYPSLCLQNIDIMEFLKKYYMIFNEPLMLLRETGSYKNIISTDALFSLSKFMLSDSRTHIEPFHPTHECLLQIINLCKKASLYYNIGCELQKEMKYEHTGTLHCAMHTVILQMREALRTLKEINYTWFMDITNILPNIISIGNDIAHNYLDEDDYKSSIILPGREYYVQEDLSALTLLNLMRNIKINLEEICAIRDAFLDERSNTTFTYK